MSAAMNAAEPLASLRFRRLVALRCVTWPDSTDHGPKVSAI
jgi:hypothetical protein